MSRVTILDPTAASPEVNADPGPPARRKIGIRHDPTWRSFEWIMDEWAVSFRVADAEVETWSAGSRVGAEGAATAAELGRFVDRSEVLVLGLGN